MLVERGFQILDRNYRVKRGELDLVARDGEYLVFVEVRARRSERLGEAVETIGPSKRAALLRAARAWIEAHDAQGQPVRFDVITFSGEELEIGRHIEDTLEVADPWV
jgi:putative endonuclease